jgi:hypothetical protein
MRQDRPVCQPIDSRSRRHQQCPTRPQRQPRNNADAQTDRDRPFKTSTRNAAGSCGAGVAFRAYRRWHLHWGATGTEANSAYPGDHLIAQPRFAPTRALTINAPPEQVWPWIVQIGLGRAGFYSYDWLDNLGRPSANEILSEWQHPQVGDLAAPMSPFTKSPTDATAFRVAGLEVNRWLLWEQRLSTWVWVIEPVDESRTRLVTRIRARYDWSGPLAIVWLLLMELGDFPMMRKQLVGIKERAETLASKAPLSRATAPA